MFLGRFDVNVEFERLGANGHCSSPSTQCSVRQRTWQASALCDEVVTTLASRALDSDTETVRKVYPNGDVNLEQSSNDIFPSALHIAVSDQVERSLRPLTCPDALVPPSMIRLRRNSFIFWGKHHEQKSNSRHCLRPRWQSSTGSRETSWK
jgi:hypothetical protein